MFSTRPSPLEATPRQPLAFVQPDHARAQLAREFTVTARNSDSWVTHPHTGSGKRVGGNDALTRAEREELAWLRAENKRLLQECEVLLASGGGLYP